MITRQYPTIVLPQIGAGVETVNDAVVHYSIEIPTVYLQEKVINVYCTLAAGAPGPVNCWVEVSPFPLAMGNFYAPLGVPVGVAATGNISLPWTAHSEWARIGIQCLGGTAVAFWTLFAIFSAKGDG